MEVKLREAAEILMGAKTEYNPLATIALVSGGRDSVAMLAVSRPYITHVAHIETGIGIPQTTQFVEGLCEQWELPLIKLVTPPEVYRKIIFAKLPTGETHGFPGPPAHRVCYWHLKQQRLRELRSMFVTNGRKQRVIFVTGIRIAESQRRMRRLLSVPVRREGSTVWVSPLINWTNTDLKDFYKVYNEIPRNPVSERIHRSGECLCGAFAKSTELTEIEFWYPETAKYIMEMEEELKHLTTKHSKWGGQGRKGKRSMTPLCIGCAG